MLLRRTLLQAIALCAPFLAVSPIGSAAAEEGRPLKVVASFSILGDLTARVGGDDIALRVLVGPDADAHVYRPTPDDAAAIADADVLIVNGLGFEGWLERMGEAADFKGTKVVASDGVEPLTSDGEDGHEDHDGHADHADHGEHDEHAEHDAHNHGGMDPHAWQDLANARIYVSNIAKALSDADPANIEDYKARAAALIAEIDALETHTRAAIAAIPAERRIIITNHDAFGYFENAYGVTFLSATGISTDAEPDPKAIAALIDIIRDDGVTAIFLENLSDNRLITQISEETGVVVGGTLYSDSLSGPDGPATSYLAMFAHNVDALVTAMRGATN